MEHVDLATGEVTRHRPRARISARARRALRLGPHGQVVRRPARHTEDPGAEASPARVLVEWHDMTPGELIAEWSGLRAWVAWLTGRYELTVEDRLPPCWALHPGLVEELHALRAWREEIYSLGSAGQGQAARYWHAELRSVIQAATTFYAAGCRTGHRGAAELSSIDRGLLREWGGAYPLAGVPGLDIRAGQARFTDSWTSGETIALWLDTGAAVPVTGSEMVRRQGATWAPAAGGWVQVLDLDNGGRPGAQTDDEAGSWTA